LNPLLIFSFDRLAAIPGTFPPPFDLLLAKNAKQPCHGVSPFPTPLPFLLVTITLLPPFFLLSESPPRARLEKEWKVKRRRVFSPFFKIRFRFSFSPSEGLRRFEAISPSGALTLNTLRSFKANQVVTLFFSMTYGSYLINCNFAVAESVFFPAPFTTQSDDGFVLLADFPLFLDPIFFLPLASKCQTTSPCPSHLRISVPVFLL